MSTWEMMQFWVIKEIMPVLIFIGVFVGIVLSVLIWDLFEAIASKIRKKMNNGRKEKET